jgi:hypothetical protein
MSLDPDTENPRRFLANLTTRTIHRTDSADAACRPAPTDALGFGDSLAYLEGQGLFACRVCEPADEREEE